MQHLAHAGFFGRELAAGSTDVCLGVLMGQEVPDETTEFQRGVKS
jgi:hypothetical protein